MPPVSATAARLGRNRISLPVARSVSIILLPVKPKSFHSRHPVIVRHIHQNHCPLTHAAPGGAYKN
jgi:hypothetical protein